MNGRARAHKHLTVLHSERVTVTGETARRFADMRLIVLTMTDRQRRIVMTTTATTMMASETLSGNNYNDTDRRKRAQRYGSDVGGVNAACALTSSHR